MTSTRSSPDADFAYDPQTDTFQCPAGRILVRKQILTKKRSVLYVAQDCSGRHLYEDALERMNARVEADPSLMRQRRCAAEHPFGTIKRMTAGGRYLTRGLAKVRAETALSVLAYNILRTINLLGVGNLKARFRLSPQEERPRITGASRFHTACTLAGAFLYITLIMDQAACAFRFLRTPKRPTTPRPPAKRGRVAGRGVAPKWLIVGGRPSSKSISLLAVEV